MNPKVIQVHAGPDYTLSVWFANGEHRLFDMKPYLDYEVFQALKDPKIFDSVTTFLGSITWSNDSDLSYDTLYLGSVPVVN
ncbi:MAG: DUF2442 domain-containing protein [Alistipes sp.]|jgi:hypothetical protein|nr:DUF2442 domain-containing protein [Alistipes sp.]